MTMAHPLIGTVWIDPANTRPPILIGDEVAFKTNWQDLRDHYIPDKDYVYKVKGLNSTYLLASIYDDSSAVFLNLDKNNKQKIMPLVDAVVLDHSTLRSGLVTKPLMSQATIQTTPTPSVTVSIPVTSTVSMTLKKAPAATGKTLREILLKKVTSPKQRCETCGGTKTLMFNFYMCDNGCK
jgi:hypothetical protein